MSAEFFISGPSKKCRGAVETRVLRRLVTFCLSAPCTSTLTYLLTLNRAVERWRVAAGWKSEGVAVTSGGRLQCQKIFHVHAGKSDLNAWRAVIGRCFAEADAAGIKSLALPPVGTGRPHIGQYLVKIASEVWCLFLTHGVHF